MSRRALILFSIVLLLPEHAISQDKPVIKPVVKPEALTVKPGAKPLKPGAKPEATPTVKPGAKPMKPGANSNVKPSTPTALKPGMKPSPPPPPSYEHPPRDPLPVAAAIDREIERRLAEAKVPLSPQADDEEFLRRPFLDIAGRIPTLDEATQFLDDTDPDKRRKLIDKLLTSQDYGRHVADLWRPLLAPRDPSGKPGIDKFGPWLAEQFNRNRGWNAIAAELIGTTGDIKDRPETSFLMANGEMNQPKPNLVASAVGKVFLGVQIQCAECHDHPFAPWKQADFWGVAAYFGKLRNSGTKGPPWALTEDPDPNPATSKMIGIHRPAMKPGGVIVIPADGGNKGAGQEIAAKVLGGTPAALDDSAAFRPAFVSWATSRENPYFARAFVNRLWAQLFNRGLVHPVDDLREDNPATHPAVLDLLAAEFAASDFDVKHLVRCIALTRAYQRSSKPIAGNESDTELLSRMAVKPIGPESLFDSLAVLHSGKFSPMKPAQPMKPTGAKPGFGYANPRDAFAAYFRGAGGAAPGEFDHGIPQFLRRMNGEAFAASPPLVERIARDESNPEKVVEKLYLATLSRRPTAEERKITADYIARKTSPHDGYSGVLWALLNSSEFALNR